MEYKEVTETIIGCAYRVYNKMGFGFLESVYQKCLLTELKSVRRIVKPRACPVKFMAMRAKRI